jgi:hypothetical protein
MFSFALGLWLGSSLHPLFYEDTIWNMPLMQGITFIYLYLSPVV